LDEADNGVEGSTSVASAKDDVGKKGNADGPAAPVSILGRGGNRVLDHQNNADEQESAESFAKVSSFNAGGRLQDSVDGSSLINSHFHLPQRNVSQHHADAATSELSSG